MNRMCACMYALSFRYWHTSYRLFSEIVCRVPPVQKLLGPLEYDKLIYNFVGNV